MKQTRIKVKDKKQFEVVIDLMLKSGRKFSPGNTTATSAEDYANKVYSSYPHPMVDSNNNITASYNADITFCWPEDATAIINLLFTKTYEVENVGDYTAKITDVGISVGCQTISFDKFKEIVDKVAEFKADH